MRGSNSLLRACSEPPVLEIAAPGLLGAASALEIAAPSLLGAASAPSVRLNTLLTDAAPEVSNQCCSVSGLLHTGELAIENNVRRCEALCHVSRRCLTRLCFPPCMYMHGFTLVYIYICVHTLLLLLRVLLQVIYV